MRNRKPAAADVSRKLTTDGVNRKQMTASELLKEGITVLRKKGVPDAEVDAKELLLAAFHWNAQEWLLRLSEPAPEDSVQAYRELLNKRAERIPLQHLLGEAWFFGYRFFVNSDVLIPRFDTEILVEETLKAMKECEAHQLGEEEQTGAAAHPGENALLDLCTGSGCIAISLKKERQEWTVSASDFSSAALFVAKKNSEMNQAEIRLIESDLFENIQGRFQVIVSNPPYIDAEEMETLEPEVRDHDPKMALFGGTDGLDFYRKIIEIAPDFLEKNGRLLFEIGDEQGKAVSEMMAARGFSDVRVIQDLSGRDRVVRGTWPKDCTER